VKHKSEKNQSIKKHNQYRQEHTDQQ